MKGTFTFPPRFYRSCLGMWRQGYSQLKWSQKTTLTNTYTEYTAQFVVRRVLYPLFPVPVELRLSC